jgi:hypothetical protein
MYLQIVFNRYLAETRRADDLDALTALPFFLSMRAAIPKVMPGAVIVRSDIERKALFGIAETEKRLPLRAPPPPCLVAPRLERRREGPREHGLAGAGKTADGDEFRRRRTSVFVGRRPRKRVPICCTGATARRQSR